MFFHINANYINAPSLEGVQNHLSIIELNNGNLLIAGQNINNYAMIAQITPEGDFISIGLDHMTWQLSSGSSKFTDVIKTYDNKLIFIGYTSNEFQSEDVLTIKMNQNIIIKLSTSQFLKLCNCI